MLMNYYTVGHLVVGMKLLTVEPESFLFLIQLTEKNIRAFIHGSSDLINMVWWIVDPT